MIELKKQLYHQCLEHVQSRLDAAQLAINEAQMASNDDTKSSAGDKYETGREMAQQEANRNMGQLNEANKLKIALNRISPNNITDTVDTGSLVVTDKANFYIAISAGTLIVNNGEYIAVSPFSPIGTKLKGLKAGDKFNLNE
ncbi:3-oxoacyl-ACP synthase, partial [uncultured Mucilaginibacter sp.]|uniref:3-oxoacyl-ACP synthase n=1 Tax=uncultured Mucilaginibacter sp. TaxID=797541 RepID=UPI0025EA629F